MKNRIPLILKKIGEEEIEISIKLESLEPLLSIISNDEISTFTLGGVIYNKEELEWISFIDEGWACQF